MDNRKLINGAETVAFDISVILEVRTKCPGKYKLVDMETGEEYMGRLPTEDNPQHWLRLEVTRNQIPTSPEEQKYYDLGKK